MYPAVILLRLRETNPSERNLAKLLIFYGIRFREFQISDERSLAEAVLSMGKNKFPVILVNGSTFGNMIRILGEECLHELIYQRCKYLFLYDLHPDENSNISVQYLSRGSIGAVTSLETETLKYNISNEFREITPGLSGLHFGPINRGLDLVLNISQNNFIYKSIISINKHPFFIMFTVEQCNIFIAASRWVADIDEKLQNTYSVKEHFSTLIPSVIFIKYVLQEYAWHKSNIYANLVIDDPFLKKKYGFLDFNKLLKSMDEHDFTTSIAFIPWNYKRTDERIAKIFRERSDRFSICVHGCDHTNFEYATEDEILLTYKTILSEKRMDLHEKMTGLPYKKVMSFPHGYYSTPSLKVLKGNNYLGAFHSSARPVDVDESRYSIRDYLELCVMCYENFPLFLRRYPGNIIDTKIDIFLGKNLFFVHHHDYFKNGHDELAHFIENLHLDRNQVIWAGLDEIMANMYLTRKSYNGFTYCKIYTNDVWINNTSEYMKKYVIIKEEKQNVQIKNVFVGGEKINIDFDDFGYMAFHLNIESGNKVRIQIQYEEMRDIDYFSNMQYSAKVYLRRMLSEFRDSYLSRNNFLLSISNKYKKYLIKKL